MVERSNLTVYITGPRTGIENFNREAFAAAERKYQERGYNVVVQKENSFDPIELAARRLGRHKERMLLSRGIDILQEQADFVVGLEGYRGCPISRLEILVATALGVPVLRDFAGELDEGQSGSDRSED